MEIHKFFDARTDWFRHPPAEEAAVQKLVDTSGLDFPVEYLDLLRYSNGGSGKLAAHPLWFDLYPVEEV
jgi:hypothetical protein